VKPPISQANRSAQLIGPGDVDRSVDRRSPLGDLLVLTTPAHRVERLRVVIHVRGRPGAQAIGLPTRDVLLGNSAGEHAPCHLDPMSHCGKNLSAGVSGVDLAGENVAPKVSKRLVRERLCAHSESVRRTNSDASV
jgi:hypothetical protein